MAPFHIHDMTFYEKGLENASFLYFSLSVYQPYGVVNIADFRRLGVACIFAVKRPVCRLVKLKAYPVCVEKHNMFILEIMVIKVV